MLSPDIAEFLEEIQTWMVENNYECGKQGSQIFERITKILEGK